MNTCQTTPSPSAALSTLLMQRNSSFFWASDDLREHGGDDDCSSGDDGGVENGEGSRRRIQIGWTDSIEEEDDHELEESNRSIDPAAISPERIALNRSYGGYGSANVEMDAGVCLRCP